MSANNSADVSLVEDFFGVYMLYSLNPKYRGRTYIGFTVDPSRRLKQHNKGSKFGGAAKTSNRGPWEMILILHGFPNQISALRFEWAWQHPKRSRRLKYLPPKKSSERMFEYNVRLLGEMLNLGPWNRLPLTLRWLRPDVKYAEFTKGRLPPEHMSIVRGPVKSVKSKAAAKTQKNPGADGEEEEEDLICSICIETATREDRVQCLSDRCGAISHLICLAERFRGDSAAFLPLEGKCPVCEVKCLWGDIVKKKKLAGGQNIVEEAEKREEEDDEDVSDSD